MENKSFIWAQDSHLIYVALMLSAIKIRKYMKQEIYFKNK